MAWNPWSSSGQDLHPSRYLMSGSHSHKVPRRVHTAAPSWEDALYSTKIRTRLRWCGRARYIVGAEPLNSELLRTLSKVAASEPTSRLSMRLPSLFPLAFAGTLDDGLGCFPFRRRSIPADSCRDTRHRYSEFGCCWCPIRARKHPVALPRDVMTRRAAPKCISEEPAITEI